MSNKPNIYGYCPAGCKWETVHRDEFERSASIIECDKTDGRFILDTGKLYKIKKTTSIDSSDYGFYITVMYNVHYADKDDELVESNTILVSQNGAYKTNMFVRIAHIYLDGTYVKAVFDIDGTITTYSVGNLTQAEGVGNVKLVINDADECYLVNENAEIMAKGLPFVSAEDNGKVLCVVNGAWAAVEVTDVSQEGA